MHIYFISFFYLPDLIGVRPVKVRGTIYYDHELATQLKGAGKVKLVVSQKEDDLFDSPVFIAANLWGRQAGGILGCYAH